MSVMIQMKNPPGDDVPPPIQDAGNGNQIACHIPLDQLAQAQRSTSEQPLLSSPCTPVAEAA